MRGIGHEHILNYRFDQVFDGERWERVMTVETDIELDPQAEGYDAEAEQNLLGFLASYLEKIKLLTRSIHLTTVRLKPGQSRA